MLSTLQGLYVITDSSLIPSERFLETVEQAILGGARVIQYRDKSDNHCLRVTQAKALCELCHHYRLPLIINDDIALMQRVSADGVHLGKEDANIAYARSLLGDQVIIGVSCYNQLSLAIQAVENGASYVAFGRFFPSSTKPHAVHASLDLLRQARHSLPHCPIVAIGGITPHNGAQLIAAGADSLAVIHGIFGQSEVTQAARQYAQLFEV